MFKFNEKDFLNTALQYAKLNLKTFPVKYQGKTPLCDGGFKAATKEPEQIKGWSKQFSQFNLAMPTGHENGIFVVDIDGKDGFKSLEILENKFGKLNAPSASTGKGKHLYFKYPTDIHIKNSVKKISSGIDIRGEGGYVVVPPSIHENGNKYSWENTNLQDISFPEAPQWLLNLIENPPETKLELQNLLDKIANAPEGERNQTLLENSRYILNYLSKHKEIDPDETVKKMFEVAQKNGLPEKEIQKTIQNTLTFLNKVEDNKLIQSDFKELDMSIIYEKNIQDAPKMDLSMFKELSKWISDTAESTNTPVDYVAFSLLAAASGIIGLSRSVSPWINFEEYPCLYMGIVGNPSMGKTPALSPIKKLLNEVEQRRKKDYLQAKKKWEGKKKQVEYAYAQWEKSVKDNANNPNFILPDEAIIPQKPQNYRFVFGDITQESLVQQLENNIKGAIVFRDELSGWLGAMNKYKFGNSDSHFWLECYVGNSYTADRVKFADNQINIPHLLVSIFGSIQPRKVVEGFLNTTEDGLVSRFIWAYPAPIPPENPKNSVDNTLVKKVLFFLDDLLNPYTPEPEKQKRCYSLDPGALACFKDWRKNFLTELRKMDEDNLIYFLGKAPGTVLRLALILELLWLAIDGGIEKNSVSFEAMQNAIDFYEKYLIPMARRVYECIYFKKRNIFAVSLAKWILENKPTSFRLVDIYYNGNIPHINDKEKAKEATKILLEYGWLKMWKRRQGGTAGRKSVGFDVNPEIYQNEEQNH